ncbi:unnamed protein product [Musa acuminata var. zebrina]
MAGGKTPGGSCTSMRCVPRASRDEFSVTLRRVRIMPSPAAISSKRLSRRSRRPRQRRSPAAASLGGREIERNLLLSQQKHRLSQRSQHIHYSPTSHHLQPRWCNIPYRLVL